MSTIEFLPRSNTSERKREGVRGQPDPPVAAGGGTEALELGVDITPMAAANSGSAKRASSGGEGRRGKRYPSGLHQHCPAMGAVGPVVVVDVAWRLWCSFPSAKRSRDRIGISEGKVAAVNLGYRAPAPLLFFYSASDGGPPVITDWAPLIRARQGVWPNLWIGP